jgi:hypothetical protein
VRSLPPGHCMRITDGSPAAPRRYYDVVLPRYCNGFDQRNGLRRREVFKILRIKNR